MSNHGKAKTVQVLDVQIGKRPRKDMGDIDSLAASMADLGLLQPIVVRPDMSLVAGERRLKAAKQLGWNEIFAHVVTNLDEALPFLRAERDENTCRKDFTPTEAVALGKTFEKHERVEAKRRQTATQAKPGHKVGCKVRESYPNLRAELAMPWCRGRHVRQDVRAGKSCGGSGAERAGEVRQARGGHGSHGPGQRRLPTLD